MEDTQSLIDKAKAITTLSGKVELLRENEQLQAEVTERKSAHTEYRKEAMEYVKKTEAELADKQELIDRLCSPEPCPKCGYGITGACYGCEIKRLKESNFELTDENCNLHVELKKYRWIPAKKIPQKINGWVEFINPSIEVGGIGGICWGRRINIRYIKQNYVYWRPITLPERKEDGK